MDTDSLVSRGYYLYTGGEYNFFPNNLHKFILFTSCRGRYTTEDVIVWDLAQKKYLNEFYEIFTQIDVCTPFKLEVV